MSNKRHNPFSPLLMAICVVIGIMVGAFYANHFSGNRLNILNTSSNKLIDMLHIVNDMYVDTVNVNKLVEDAMPEIIAKLDPHSTYISAKDFQAANDDLAGSFSGVGIQFVIREDTIRVQAVVAGGPSEMAGIIAGDKIVSVDGKPFVGDSITNEVAMRTLKGPEGSKIDIGVLRYKGTEEQVFTVTRGNVLQKSITAAYMLNDETGYIRVKNFGGNTYAEMLVALGQLNRENFSSIVVDLRGNTGGFLEAAVQMVNEFLPDNSMIVYTEGNRFPRQEFHSNGHGIHKNMPIIVLIDESSASASEIFAGAIQDNDRGIVIGRRSFGKGLVQQQLPFEDGSAIRLTVARYYTPSGRCIQKPYEIGDNQTYQKELVDRYEHGEFFTQDSIKHTGPKYYTVKGRTVYGGGGITPDIFVADDTTDITVYYREAVMSGMIFDFAYNYTDNNREKLNEYPTMEELVKYIDKQRIVEQFVAYAEKKQIKRRNLQIKKSYKLLKEFLVSRIVYNLLDEEDWQKYLNLSDPAIDSALLVIKEGKAFPQAPTEEED